MAGHTLFSVCLKVLLWAAWFILCRSSKCAQFTFPELNGFTVFVKENERVTLPFQIKVHENCSVSPGFVIVHQNEGAWQCVLPHTANGSCEEPLIRTSCWCRDDGSLIFSTKLNRSDNGTWNWSGNSVAETQLQFIVQYSAQVQELIISRRSQAVHLQNSTVNVSCALDNGNPPVAAVLLDRHGDVLNYDTNINREINHTYPAVGCQDAGVIRCEAPGASENKTATLLVRCPPEFADTAREEFNMSSDENLSVSFSVRAHSETLTQCGLKHASSMNAQNCLRSLTVTGEPPDLNVTIHLDNVTHEMDGQWWLTLTNEAGSGSRDFHINVALETLLPGHTNSSTAVHTEIMIVALNGGGFVLLILIVVTVNIICWQKGRKAVRQRQGNERNALEAHDEMIELRPLSGTSRSMHLYEEVRDMSGGFGAPSAPNRQSPRVGSDGYLVPVPSTSSHVHSEPSNDRQDSAVSSAAVSSGYMDMSGYVDMRRGENVHSRESPLYQNTT